MRHRRAAAVAAVEASFRARQAEEHANGLADASVEREKELDWMRGELEKARQDVASHASASEAAAENQRQVEERATAFEEEARRAAASAEERRRNLELNNEGEDQRERGELRDQANAAKSHYEHLAHEASERSNVASHAAESAMRRSRRLNSHSRWRLNPEARFNVEDNASASGIRLCESDCLR